ncbi:hypothetical protein ABK040_007078 [Willaertia magna]
MLTEQSSSNSINNNNPKQQSSKTIHVNNNNVAIATLHLSDDEDNILSCRNRTCAYYWITFLLILSITFFVISITCLGLTGYFFSLLNNNSFERDKDAIIYSHANCTVFQKEVACYQNDISNTYCYLLVQFEVMNLTTTTLVDSIGIINDNSNNINTRLTTLHATKSSHEHGHEHGTTSSSLTSSILRTKREKRRNNTSIAANTKTRKRNKSSQQRYVVAQKISHAINRHVKSSQQRHVVVPHGRQHVTITTTTSAAVLHVKENDQVNLANNKSSGSGSANNNDDSDFITIVLNGKVYRILRSIRSYNIKSTIYLDIVNSKRPFECFTNLQETKVAIFPFSELYDQYRIAGILLATFGSILLFTAFCVIIVCCLTCQQTYSFIKSVLSFVNEKKKKFIKVLKREVETTCDFQEKTTNSVNTISGTITINKEGGNTFAGKENRSYSGANNNNDKKNIINTSGLLLVGRDNIGDINNNNNNEGSSNLLTEMNVVNSGSSNSVISKQTGTGSTTTPSSSSVDLKIRQ